MDASETLWNIQTPWNNSEAPLKLSKAPEIPRNLQKFLETSHDLKPLRKLPENPVVFP